MHCKEIYCLSTSFDCDVHFSFCANATSFNYQMIVLLTPRAVPIPKADLPKCSANNGLLMTWFCGLVIKSTKYIACLFNQIYTNYTGQGGGIKEI